MSRRNAAIRAATHRPPAIDPGHCGNDSEANPESCWLEDKTNAGPKHRPHNDRNDNVAQKLSGGSVNQHLSTGAPAPSPPSISWWTSARPDDAVKDCASSRPSGGPPGPSLRAPDGRAGLGARSPPHSGHPGESRDPDPSAEPIQSGATQPYDLDPGLRRGDR